MAELFRKLVLCFNGIECSTTDAQCGFPTQKEANCSEKTIEYLNIIPSPLSICPSLLFCILFLLPGEVLFSDYSGQFLMMPLFVGIVGLGWQFGSGHAIFLPTVRLLLRQDE
ncbi:hypothetical protein L6452_14077 [Arctium lappa]|uniref:Uncharacterized protein n=1 Tax=Arctium lappa TaxID=4217 RepID=A0ACB9CJZ8_ARCLA|nr:hypothetical protein L6452_14077 [Arctium lappa]